MKFTYLSIHPFIHLFFHPLFNGLIWVPWRRERLPTPVFWPGKFHGLYSLWGRKEPRLSDFHFNMDPALCLALGMIKNRLSWCFYWCVEEIDSNETVTFISVLLGIGNSLWRGGRVLYVCINNKTLLATAGSWRHPLGSEAWVERWTI